MSVSLNGEFRRDRLVLWFVAALLFVVLLYVAWRYVGTVLLGLFVYYVTRPVFQRIYGRLGSRTLAVVVSIFTVALPVLVLVTWTGIVAVQGLVDLVQSPGFEELRGVVEPYLDLTELRDQFESVFSVALSDPRQITSVGGSAASNLFGTLVDSLAVLFNVMIHLFIVLVITFYLLRDDHRVAAWGRETFAGEGSVLDAYFVAVDRDLKNVYFGNILNALVTGLLGAVVYSLLNTVAPDAVQIPEPLLLGLVTGVASLIPVIGMKLVWVPIALVLLGDALVTDPATAWFAALFALVSTVVVDYIPDQLLRPYVSGRTLHVGAVMLAYIVGPILFGWYGIFLGPLVLVVVFEFARIVVPWLVDPEYEPPADDVPSTPAPDSPAGGPPSPTGPPDSSAASFGGVPSHMLAPVDDDGGHPDETAED